MLLIATITSAIISIITYGAFIIVWSFMVWMAVDAAKQDRFWWVAIIFGVPVVGVVVYYFTEKKHEYATAESHHIHKSETEAQHETSHKEHAHHRKEDAVEKMAHEEKHEEKQVEKSEDKKDHLEEKHTHEKKENKKEIIEEVVVEIKEEK